MTTPTITKAQRINLPEAQKISNGAENLLQANPFQPGGGEARMTPPGSSERGICTLTFGDRVYQFRTNPNSVWWSYELITHVEQTYGGRVIQILGTRLGDLSVRVECGEGGWDYLMNTVLFLRDLMVDQRNGKTATFEYTTRNWKLNVYAMSIPFQDEVTATTREIEIQFKIQEDVSGVISQTSINSELAHLQDGVFRMGQAIHNQYNDHSADTPLNPAGRVGAMIGVGMSGLLGGNGTGIPYVPTNNTNTVDTNPQGNNPGGMNPFSFLASVLSFI